MENGMTKKDRDYYAWSNYRALHRVTAGMAKIEPAAYLMFALTEEFIPLRELLNKAKDNSAGLRNYSGHVLWEKLVVLGIADVSPRIKGGMVSLKRGKDWNRYQNIYGIYVNEDEYRAHELEIPLDFDV